MKRKIHILIAIILAASLFVGQVPAMDLKAYDEAKDIVVLYTNDVHNSYEKIKGDTVGETDKCLGYASVAYYKNQIEKEGKQVELIDMGDALQGSVIGTLSKGDYIRQIMEQIGYSIAIPGNHEFDYGMNNFLNLAAASKYSYISCNFMDSKTNQPVFSPYKIVDYDGRKVAYIGISTPKTITSSRPSNFQDDNGEFIYNFCQDMDGQKLYQAVQKAIDDAKAEGADTVIAMGHLGVEQSCEPWTSYNVIANTSGLDVFLDGHSHSTIASEIREDYDGNEVVLSSTGSNLKNLGQLTIHSDGTVAASLITKIDEQDADTLNKIIDITEQFNSLQNTVVAKTEVDLCVNDPTSGNRIVRSQETNLGDLVADAYRNVTGADIALINGGGVRADIESGDITYGQIVKVQPFDNKICMVEATGQQILDALERGAYMSGIEESGAFLQVSGLTYDINTGIHSNVQFDVNNYFVKVDGAYKVNNVKVGGEALDLNKTYTVASHNYMLKSSGDGYSMFKGCTLVQDEVMLDNQALIQYIVDTLKGIITADSVYANPYGQGRIRFMQKSEQADSGQIAGEQAKGQSTSTEAAASASSQVIKQSAGQKCVLKNKTKTYKGVVYKVSKPGTAGVAQAAVSGVSSKKIKKADIVSKITIDGVACEVRAIGKKAFANCRKLKTIKIHAKAITSIGKNAFQNLYKKATFYVLKNRKKKFSKLLNKKTGFRKSMKINYV